MNSHKRLIKVPWSKVIVLITALIKAAKGGITKEEGAELLDRLTAIVADVALQSVAEQ